MLHLYYLVKMKSTYDNLRDSLVSNINYACLVHSFTLRYVMRLCYNLSRGAQTEFLTILLVMFNLI